MSQQSKLKITVLLLLILTMASTGCWFKKPSESKVGQEEFETGTVIDVSDKSGQEVTVKIGDVIYLKLEGESKSGFQWQVISPTSESSLILKDHKVVGIDDPNVLGGKFTDEWWLKVQEAGETQLQFSYVMPTKPLEAKKSFELKVISQ